MTRIYDPKTAPIRFRRVEPGVYLSTCGNERAHSMAASDHPSAAWERCPTGICGRFRITKTEHTGHNTTHQGRTRWWLLDVYRDSPVYFIGYGSSRHFLSLEDAVESLNVKIGRGIQEAFGLVAKYLRDRQNAEDVRVEREEVRAARVETVAEILRGTYAHMDTAQATAEQIISTLFPELDTDRST